MSDLLVDEFLESYIYWMEACEDVRTAYRRWQDSKEPGRGIEFSLYSAALDHEEYAAAIHSSRTARVRYGFRTVQRPPKATMPWPFVWPAFVSPTKR